MVAPNWLVVTVRIWRAGDRHLIRLLARSEFDEMSRVAIETSSHAAASRLEAWLGEFGELSSGETAQDTTAHEDDTPD